ncbi:MAG: shikimate dehydrogenase, partial [Candidatus Xenobia bacterium]
AHLLAPQVRSMALVARNLLRLKRIAESIESESGRSPQIYSEVAQGIVDADIIITATSSTGNIIRAQDIKPGAVICDVSMPHDVCREVAQERPDVLVEVPGAVDFRYDFGYPPGLALACMAETMILTLEERWENFSLGRGIRREQVEEISRLARKHGFRLAGFRSFDRQITDSDVDAVRIEARKRLKDVTYSISEAV